MFKPSTYVILLVSLFLLSCKQKIRTEKADVAFWNATVVDSCYRILYSSRDTSKALQTFDSLFAQKEPVTAYPKAARFGILANYHYFFTGDNKATAEMIDSALALFNTPDLQNRYPRTYVHFLLFGGQTAYRLFQYNKANEYYYRAKKIADRHLNPCERTAFHYSIAMVLYRQQNFRQSLNYFTQAFNLQATCAPQTTAVLLQQQEIQSNIGLCLVQLKKYDRAMTHFDNALKIAEKYRDSLGTVTMDKIYGVIYGNKAKVATARLQLKEAEELSLKSIALNDREGYEVENAFGVKLQLAEVYNRKKDFASMFGVLDGARAMVEGVNSRRKLEWRRLMASYFEQTAQPDSALHFLKNYFLLGDSISLEQEKLTAADIARQLREKEQLLQITMLKKDNELAVVSLWVTVIFSGMALAIIFLVYYNYRHNKKSLAHSLALNEEIRQQKTARENEVRQRHKLITEAVIRAQENERTAIGLELHDNINQVLTTVKLQAEMVLQGVGDPKVILPRTLKYLQDCINEIRGLSKRLSAPTLGKISLQESVKDLIDSINLTSKVKITRQFSGLDNDILKQDLHIGVYRILQEQLNNVLKHADATEVNIRLEKNNDRIRLLISDNGKGFIVNNSKSGIGMINMQTRAESLNGSFQLKSEPGQGCKIEVVLPYVQ